MGPLKPDLMAVEFDALKGNAHNRAERREDLHAERRYDARRAKARSKAERKRRRRAA